MLLEQRKKEKKEKEKKKKKEKASDMVTWTKSFSNHSHLTCRNWWYQCSIMKTYLELAPGCLISFLYVLQNAVLCEGKKTIIINFPDKVIEPMLFIWHP